MVGKQGEGGSRNGSEARAGQVCWDGLPMFITLIFAFDEKTFIFFPRQTAGEYFRGVYVTRRREMKVILYGVNVSAPVG